MTRTASGPNWIQRLWTLVIEASATAVAVHYRAPWEGRASR
ncbi:hypothetical protein [Sphingopyxis sp.]|nr:hypothetical protein [Sphingopyxis sp.]